MRLINSDGQIDEVTVDGSGGGSASNSTVRLDVSAISLLGALAVMMVTVGFSVWALADGRYTRSLIEVQQAAWERSFDDQLAQSRRTETEARVAINHYMQHTAKESANARQR